VVLEEGTAKEKVVVVLEEEDAHKSVDMMGDEEEEEEERRRKGGIKKTSTNSYTAPTSTIVPPFFRYQPTDHGFRFCGIPNSPLRLVIISPYFAGNFYLCMETTYILFIHHMHVLWKI
jgi:hypothetical protein